MKLFPFFSAIPTHYDERKAAAAAAFLLQAAGGKMKFIRLIKLLYMADRAAWSRYGRPITGDEYVAMEHGPVLSKTYELIKSEGEHPEPTGTWQETVQRASSHDVMLRGEPDYGPLSEAELEILRDVYEEYRAMDTWELIRHLHDVLPEWRDQEPKPGKRNDIRPEDILKAVGKEDKIKAVREDMEELEAFQKLLGAR